MSLKSFKADFIKTNGGYLKYLSLSFYLTVWSVSNNWFYTWKCNV